MPLPGSRSRYVFALPQADGLVYLGLTDEPVDGPVPDADPVPDDAEVQQLLDTVNQVLAEPLTRARPRRLVRRAAAAGAARLGGHRARAATADLSRKHLLQWDGPVLTVVGGKLTTYRAMAEETVDAVVARLGRGAPARSPAGCRWWGRHRVRPWRGWVRRPGWWPVTATEAPVVEALGSGARSLAGRLETVGELRFAVRHEGARTVADLLDRRTRIGLVPADRARAVETAEQVLGEEH